MLITGLASVTFRKYGIQKVVSLAKKAGLAGIEWGGDIHVPPMNFIAADEARERTEDAGLKTFSYGSYYSPLGAEDFLGEAEKVFETARRLNALRVRIWAGDKWRNEATEQEFDSFVERMRKVGDLAEQYGITVCFEHHQNTFCDSGKDALSALEAIAKKNVRTYWQPIQPTEQANLDCIELLKNYVDTIHVYHWKGWDRYLLEEGRAHWEKYFEAFAKEERELPCLLEFSKDDAEENFFSDAHCLLSLI